MASKRMFSEIVIETEDFLGLSAEAQALYLHLNMRADDDGFLNNLTRLISYYETDPEHIDELEDKGYLIKFDNSNCVIRHWKQNNFIQKIKYRPSSNTNKEKVELINNVYELIK